MPPTGRNRQGFYLRYDRPVFSGPMPGINETADRSINEQAKLILRVEDQMTNVQMPNDLGFF